MGTDVLRTIEVMLTLSDVITVHVVVQRIRQLKDSMLEIWLNLLLFVISKKLLKSKITNCQNCTSKFNTVYLAQSTPILFVQELLKDQEVAKIEHHQNASEANPITMLRSKYRMFINKSSIFIYFSESKNILSTGVSPRSF